MIDGDKQGTRGPKDGGVTMARYGESAWLLTAEQDGTRTELLVSTYNAWRIFGMMALMLGIKLPQKLAKSIHL